MAVQFPAPLNLYLPLTGGTLTGALAGTSLALGGATIGTNALAVTGTSTFSTTATFSGSAFANGAFYGGGTSTAAKVKIGTTGVAIDTNNGIYWLASTGNLDGAGDNSITRRSAYNYLFGGADQAAPNAQTFSVQGVVAGTADTAGQNWTFTGSVSTGAGVPGDLVFQTPGKGAASTVQNTLITALTIKGGTTNNTNVGYPSVVIGTAALGTTATDGFLYIPTCAGPPTGTPTTFTGRVALVYDSTNHQFYIFDGGWKQPKTPAAAAIVTWQ